jgi:uncharacterized repeat protein (TIGR03803 family)
MISMVASAQTFNLLVNFDGPNGSDPMPAGSLTQGLDGYLYGTTKLGGAYGFGTIFRLSKDGTVETLYSFCAQQGCIDGSNPNVGLILGTGGSLYGTTYSGGTKGNGVIFKIDTRASFGFTTLHSFSGNPDGAHPSAALLRAVDGCFYGTTYSGGIFDYGTVFEMSAAGAVTILHNFDQTDGGLPGAALIQATSALFYGTCQIGGANGQGVVFAITSRGVLSIVHNFNSFDGAQPVAPLLQALDGNFYGTTQEGGQSEECGMPGCGTVFRLSPKGRLIVLQTFEVTERRRTSGRLNSSD